jgi:hypothetical protein
MGAGKSVLPGAGQIAKDVAKMRPLSGGLLKNVALGTVAAGGLYGTAKGLQGASRLGHAQELKGPLVYGTSSQGVGVMPAWSANRWGVPQVGTQLQ